MALIRPCADLRNKYNEISTLCHQTNEPVYITKNGYNDLVLLSNEAYEQYEEERINKLISKHFDKNYPDFDSFKKEIYAQIEKGLQDIKNGRFQSMEAAVAETDEKYDFH